MLYFVANALDALTSVSIPRNPGEDYIDEPRTGTTKPTTSTASIDTDHSYFRLVSILLVDLPRRVEFMYIRNIMYRRLLA